MQTLSTIALALVTGGAADAPVIASEYLCSKAIFHATTPPAQFGGGPDAGIDVLRNSELCTALNADQFRNVVRDNKERLGL